MYLSDVGANIEDDLAAQIDALPVPNFDAQPRERRLDGLLAVWRIQGVLDLDLEDSRHALDTKMLKDVGKVGPSSPVEPDRAPTTSHTTRVGARDGLQVNDDVGKCDVLQYIDEFELGDEVVEFTLFDGG